MSIRDFRDLLIWQKAMELAQQAYQLSATLPSSEQFGLAGQIRRSGVSIPSNIAEGHGRESTKEFARFLRIARGSLAELQTQLLLSEQIGYCEKSKIGHVLALSDELGKMLRGMQKTLDSQLNTLD